MGNHCDASEDDGRMKKRSKHAQEEEETRTNAEES
jgi:hypothetical protein